MVLISHIYPPPFASEFLAPETEVSKLGSTPTPRSGPFQDHGLRPWSQSPSEHCTPYVCDPGGLLKNRETGRGRKWLRRVLGGVLAKFALLERVLARVLFLIPSQGSPLLRTLPPAPTTLLRTLLRTLCGAVRPLRRAIS